MGIEKYLFGDDASDHVDRENLVLLSCHDNLGTTHEGHRVKILRTFITVFVDDQQSNFSNK